MSTIISTARARPEQEEDPATLAACWPVSSDRELRRLSGTVGAW
jgi:hypothetical protein